MSTRFHVGLNEAVTPLGSPVAVYDTVPVKLLEGVTVMVEVAFKPWFTEIVLGLGEIV